jgi:peptidoglycan/xylan/chitin deacetylase (PgdA/CDA1 family)
MRTVVRISRTRYPAFILGSPLSRGEIPVFIYHDVEAAAFTRDLSFLRHNGYRTLCLDEYLAAREGRVRSERSVLLTFDDARKSFAEVALPLLRQFGARAVLFAPTYWMQPARRAADDLFLSWEQLRECAESGLVDVQSHAHRHALVAVSGQVVDFANPRALARFDIYDWPMRFLDGQDELGHPALGAPVYQAEPLLSARRRYLENGDATRVCCDFVARHGGVEFFAQPDWRTRLHRVFRECVRGAPGRFMPDSEFAELVASEFELSRAEFRRHLGYTPYAIAYPWMLGSRASLQLAERSGFRAVFGVAMDYRAERRRARLPTPVYARLKSDWLQFLPGEQRASVLDALARKFAGLGRAQHLAH